MQSSRTQISVIFTKINLEDYMLENEMELRQKSHQIYKGQKTQALHLLLVYLSDQLNPFFLVASCNRIYISKNLRDHVYIYDTGIQACMVYINMHEMRLVYEIKLHITFGIYATHLI